MGKGLHITTLMVASGFSFAAIGMNAANVGLIEAPGATGSIFRFPNSLQAEDDGNAFGEIWVKQGLVLYKHEDTKFQLFLQGNYVRDSAPYAYNNHHKFTYGAAFSTRIGDHLEITLTAKNEIYKELESGIDKEGPRFAFDYYYYDEWANEVMPTSSEFGLLRRTLKAYGTIVTPGSLDEDDSNIVFSPGMEYAWHFQVPNQKFTFSPFIDLHADWDKDQNNYNNKFRPAVGAKLIQPIHWGELFLGIKYEADYRPVNDTLDTGPQIYFGWYKGWNKEF